MAAAWPALPILLLHPNQGENYDLSSHLQRSPKPPTPVRVCIRASSSIRRPARLRAADPPTLLQRLYVGRSESERRSRASMGNFAVLHHSERSIPCLLWLA